MQMEETDDFSGVETSLRLAEQKRKKLYFLKK